MPAVEPGNASTPPSSTDGDGVRTIELPRGNRWGSRWPIAGLLVLAVGLAVVWFTPAARPKSSASPVSVPGAGLGGSSVRSAIASPTTATPGTALTAPSVQTPAALPADASAVTPYAPNDLASYVKPGDPEPTAAELIHALREAGEHEGIAAFNPPGTSPPLPGLAVPVDYILPPGYVRHHQVTDQGEPIEAILMYAPDAVIYDAAGQLIAIPQDRVVPPERAPAGLPIRPVAIPTP